MQLGLLPLLASVLFLLTGSLDIEAAPAQPGAYVALAIAAEKDAQAEATQDEDWASALWTHGADESEVSNLLSQLPEVDVRLE